MCWLKSIETTCLDNLSLHARKVGSLSWSSLTLSSPWKLGEEIQGDITKYYTGVEYCTSNPIVCNIYEYIYMWRMKKMSCWTDSTEYSGQPTVSLEHWSGALGSSCLSESPCSVSIYYHYLLQEVSLGSDFKLVTLLACWTLGAQVMWPMSPSRVNTVTEDNTLQRLGKGCPNNICQNPGIVYRGYPRVTMGPQKWPIIIQLVNNLKSAYAVML